MSEPHPQVARINALTRNARNTWFALLGALIFAGVTLGQIKPIDFYGVGRMTELPLVSVSVPTPLFFWAAPFLVTAIYGFFHLYLIRLWDALGTAPAWIGQARLADEIQPWLVSDGALHTRAILRKDGCAPLRALEWPATLLNFALAWAFGPVVLVFMWWQSMAAREVWMTAVSGSALALCTVIGMASLLLARQRMGRRTAATPQVWGHWAMMSIILVAAITVPPFTWSRTSGSARQLAPLVLTGEQITLRPDGWLPPGIAKREALSSWCKREAPDNCKSLTPNEEAAFESEWNQRRRTQTAGLRKPAINPLRFDDVERKLNEALGIRFSAFTQDTPGKRATFDSALDLATKGAPDFRRADLRDTFLTGANLLGANMQGVQAQGSTLERAEMILARLTGNASLLGANLIMADLRWAQMAGANFREAQLTGADLHQAQLDGADLRLALLQQANLTRAQMRDVILGGTQMQGSNLAGANMQGARLNNTQLQEANLAGAQMRRAKLNGVRMQKTRLSGAQLQEATLYGTLLSGSPGLPNRLFHTNFSWSKNVFGALRFIDLRSAVFSHSSDWRNIFLDGTTRYSPYFANRMGSPCQWTKQILSDEEFFGRWRGWTEASPRFLSGIVDYWTLYGPKEWRHVTPIPPPEGCKWKTGPMPVWHYGGR